VKLNLYTLRMAGRINVVSYSVTERY